MAHATIIQQHNNNNKSSSVIWEERIATPHGRKCTCLWSTFRYRYQKFWQKKP